MGAHPCSRHAETGARLREVMGGIPPDIPVRAPTAVTSAEIELVHDRSYVRWIREMARGDRFLDDNTYVTAATFDVALTAAGSAHAAAVRAMEGENCFALVRPPGHHAEPDRQMGFCIFNNAAVAAAMSLQEGLERIVILDWDLHHGNGTQRIFYGEERVLFLSIHQRNSFPGTGWPEEIGSGRGRGYTINAPIRSGSTVADYVWILEEVFLPAIRTHRPDLLILSAGQDALYDDPHGRMRLTPSDYGVLTSRLLSLDLPTALVLEGGYGPSHGKAIAAIFSALKGSRAEMPDNLRPSADTKNLAALLRKVMPY
ncbi:histone deacetylase family protein [Methanofollis fontis]|nr:histone deacetylase [Methanofollis fontis]